MNSNWALGMTSTLAALFFFAPRSAPPTFYKDVLPLLQEHCQSCHRAGGIGPMALMTYDEVRARAESIEQMTRLKKMPPWFADPRYGHFANDPSLNSREIEIISAWLQAGLPAGNSNDAPPEKRWVEGWNIGKPDVVVAMPRPVAIPARGVVDYTYEIVPTGF